MPAFCRFLPVGLSSSQLMPSDKWSDLLARLFAKARAPPRDSKRRKSERCTATRLTAPSARTSTARYPDGVPRMT